MDFHPSDSVDVSGSVAPVASCAGAAASLPDAVPDPPAAPLPERTRGAVGLPAVPAASAVAAPSDAVPVAAPEVPPPVVVARTNRSENAPVDEPVPVSVVGAVPIETEESPPAEESVPPVVGVVPIETVPSPAVPPVVGAAPIETVPSPAAEESVPLVVGAAPAVTAAVPAVPSVPVVGALPATVTAPETGSAAKAALAQARSSSVPTASPPASRISDLIELVLPAAPNSTRPSWSWWMNEARGPGHSLTGGNHELRRDTSRDGERNGRAADRPPRESSEGT
ncbi:MAG TPA: hypothetical protein VNM34_08330 [Verrucomicrobiae bacterium]|nr:hypothetical protein [Verrucomicrobiae bacterium]